MRARTAVSVALALSLGACGAVPDRTLGTQGVEGSAKCKETEGSAAWTRQYGSPGFDEVVVNASKFGLYTAGAFDAGSQAYLQRRDNEGIVEWEDRFAPTQLSPVGMIPPKGISPDSSGVYLCGSVTESLPGMTGHGRWDVFLKRYRHDGALEWT